MTTDSTPEDLSAQLAECRARLEAVTLGIGHELRTPLSIIRIRADLLASGAVAPEDQSKFAQEILDGVDRAMAVLEQLITPEAQAVGGTQVPKPDSGLLDTL